MRLATLPTMCCVVCTFLSGDVGLAKRNRLENRRFIKKNHNSHLILDRVERVLHRLALAVGMLVARRLDLSLLNCHFEWFARVAFVVLLRPLQFDLQRSGVLVAARLLALAMLAAMTGD
jgi:hypothetical protein